MKICWFNDNRLGLVQGDRVKDITSIVDKLPKPVYPFPPKGDALIANLDSLHYDILEAAKHATSEPVSGVKFLSPVSNPTKIIGTPTNYHDHITEANEQRADFGHRYVGTIEEQGLFLKANSALIGASQAVRPRFPDRRTDHEMELGVVIGHKASNISESEALKYVAGYCIALDMVVRGTQDRSFRKSVDTYAVLGPWLTTADEIPTPGDLDFFLSVNGEVKQKSNTKYMIMGLERQIAWASSYYTLWPGDIIMSGTCAGVGRVKPGDVMHCEIDKIGAMDVRIEAGD